MNRIESNGSFCWLEVRGDDAFTFLQGQFTQDLRGMSAGDMRYGLWLNQKGKILADSVILHIADNDFRIWSPYSPAQTVHNRLESYIIADDVDLMVANEGIAGITVSGGDASKWLSSQFGALPEAGHYLHRDGVFCFSFPRADENSWEWIGPASSLPDAAWVWSAEKTELRRIEAGLPKIPFDFGPEDLPQEAALESKAISFTKGCYLGQEVMARLHAMGRVRRRFLKVSGAGSPPVGLDLMQNDRKVAQLRSSLEVSGQSWIGLAMVSMINCDLQQPLWTEDCRHCNIQLESGI